LVRETLERAPKVIELRALCIELRDLRREELMHLPAATGAAVVFNAISSRISASVSPLACACLIKRIRSIASAP
jgi:hypothetical protein